MMSIRDAECAARRLPGMSALAVGFGLGFVEAAAIGPISLLCTRTVLRGSLAGGVAIGAGAAAVDAGYAALGAVGAARVLEIDALRLTLGLLGAAVIAVPGARTIWSAFRLRLGGEAEDEVRTVPSPGLAAARRRTGPRLLRSIDVGSGVGLLRCSGLLGRQTLRDAWPGG